MANLREFYEEFLPSGTVVSSLPLKPTSFKATRMQSHSLPREPQDRSTAALAAAAASAKSPLEAGSVVPRRLVNPAGVVENGAASDILRSGMATLGRDKQGDEAFVLTEKGVREIIDRVPEATRQLYFG